MMSPVKINELPSLSALASYDISKNGFLPEETPLICLPQAYYQPWENIVEQVSMLIDARQVRQRVDALPILTTSHLGTEQEWQRAYSILAVLAQAYIWQGPLPAERLPPSISVSFLAAAEHLEVHPVATYAALNLWNYRLIREDADLCQPQHLHALFSLTGTEDESWFFIVSNAMEARGGPIIARMLNAMEAVKHNDVTTIVDSLRYFQQSMVDIGKLLERMDERCDPQVFYHQIRPFLAGGMNMEAAGLPNGIFYDEGNGKGKWRKYRGGSNGQSSLLQCFDAVLGVTHERCGGFHSEMRDYMPGPHKRFLDDIEAIANIRGYVDRHQENTALVVAYNQAVGSLSDFRDKHIALVTRYVIIPSRNAKPPEDTAKRIDLATSTTKLAAATPSTQELVGTGGTKLIPFLKTSRDETIEASVTR